MRCLVTGCAGFIGSHLTEALLKDGDEVIGVDCFNNNYGREQKLRNLRHIGDWSTFEFVPIDLTRGELDEVVGDCEVAFHLAAEPGVRSSWGSRFEKYLDNNVLATQHVLEALKSQPETRLVFASSSSVYGNAEVRPTPEEAPTRPVSPYGQTKLSAELLCQLYQESFALDVVMLRYFTVFGPRHRPDMAFNIFCAAALEDRPITVFGDGRQTRDFTYVEDVVAATRAAASARLGVERIFNVGGGTPTSLRRALDYIAELAGKRLDVRYLQSERGDVRDTAAETSKARQHLGFDPTTTLEQGLAAEFEWLAERARGGAA